MVMQTRSQGFTQEWISAGFSSRVFKKVMILKSIFPLLSTPCEKLASLLIFSPALLRGRQESTRRNVVKPSKRVCEVRI
jgi:hypothetical protein